MGIYIGRGDGKTLVVEPHRGHAGRPAKLPKPKDQIVKIDDEVILGWPQNEPRPQGRTGNEGRHLIRRESEDELLKFEIERRSIKIQTVVSESR